jgi:hypothetical protein
MFERSIKTTPRSETTMTTSMLTHHSGGLRASDADRETAIGLLRDHWLAGRLTLDEYEERCEEATGAAFIDELRWSVRELPYPLPEHGVGGPAPAPPPAVQTPAAPATRPAAQGTGAILSVVFGTIAMAVAWVPFLFMLSLPLSISAWALGRRVRRTDRDLVRSDIRTTAIVGEAFGVLATLVGVLWLTACGIVIGSV